MESINPIEKIYRRLVAEGRPVLKLFSGNPNEQGFHFPREALASSYLRYFSAQDYHPHPKGLEEARAAIRDYYQGGGLTVDPENIILSSGTSESFFYLFSVLAQAGDNILAPKPAYPLFEHIAKLARLELRHYPLEEDKNWALNLKALQNLADARTRAVILVSPNNPTGAVTGAGQISELAAWCRQKNLPLICDEVFSEFYFGPGSYPRPAALEAWPLCFTLGGISKMFALPGLKLGWIAVTGTVSQVPPIVDALETVADTFLSCHLPIQQALPEIFTQGRDFLNAYRLELFHRRALALDLLQQVPGIRSVEPQGGFYLMARVESDGIRSEEQWVIDLLQAKGVFVHPGYFYDYESGIHFVLSFLTEPEKLQRGIEAIRKFVLELP